MIAKKRPKPEPGISTYAIGLQVWQMAGAINADIGYKDEAKSAYEIADAMLVERAETRECG